MRYLKLTRKEKIGRLKLLVRLVAITIPILIAGAVVGMLGGASLIVVIGVSIVVGYLVGKVAERIGELFKWLYEYTEKGFLTLQMQNSLERYN